MDKNKEYYLKQFSKLTEQQRKESLLMFLERHSRGFDRTPQIEALQELSKK